MGGKLKAGVVLAGVLGGWPSTAEVGVTPLPAEWRVKLPATSTGGDVGDE